MQRLIVFLLPVFFFFGCNSSQTETTEENKFTSENMKEDNRPVILCFGNSLTAGYGLEIEQSYPSLLQKRLDSLSLNFHVINAGNSGETTSGGLNRLEWVIEQIEQPIEFFVLELGANDGLRGVSTKETAKNLIELIRKVKELSPETVVVLAGMKTLPNMGADYALEFEQVFLDVANETKVELIPFFLDGVAGVPELNQEDGLHPTAQGTALVENNVWQVLKDLVQK